MRDYSKVSPQFWVGRTGKSLRGNLEAQLVALYLMSSPHAEMTGVFNCPLLYVAHETGLPVEAVTRAMTQLIRADFCTYDEALDIVFVHEMARFQIDEELKDKDKRIASVQKSYEAMQGDIKTQFFKRYGAVFKLTKSPLEAPSKPLLGDQKPLRSQEQEQEQEQKEKEAEAEPENPSAPDGAAFGEEVEEPKPQPLQGIEQLDPKALIFSQGVSLLMRAGTAESSARSFLAKYAKADERKLAGVIGQLMADPKLEPRSYIVKAMEPKQKQVAY